MYFNTIATQFDQNNLQGFISALTEAVQNGFPVTKDINNTKYGKLNLLEFMLRQIFNRQFLVMNSECEPYSFLDAVLSILTDDAKEYIKEAFGDITVYLTTLIESSVNKNKASV